MSSSFVIEATSAPHTACLIFLHGLGDTGYGWSPIMSKLAKKFPSLKFILPHAPKQRVTLNGGMKMPSWYDIYTLDENDELEDEQGLLASSKYLLDVIKEEQERIPLNKIFIGGFSQGGAVSLYTTLTNPNLKLGGVISLSAYVPCRKSLRSNNNIVPLASPIFMAHGTADMVVRYRWHQHSKEYLQSLGGVPLTVRTYEGLDHGACEQEIADMAEFIDNCLHQNITEKSDL